MHHGWITKANPLIAKPPLLRHGWEPKPCYFLPLCENEWVGHQIQWKMYPFSSSNQPTASTCHNSPALLSHDVKTFSCGEWQQLGHQMLTFKDGWSNSLLLAMSLIPLVGAEQHLQVKGAECLIAPTSRLFNLHLVCFSFSCLCTLTWEHHLVALLLLNSARWTCYFKTKRFIPSSIKNFLNCAVHTRVC